MDRPVFHVQLHGDLRVCRALRPVWGPVAMRQWTAAPNVGGTGAHRLDYWWKGEHMTIS